MEQHQNVIKVRAVILHEGKLLVAQHSLEVSSVALPGGKLEWGEDLKECLTREMVEEFAVKPDIGRLLYINMYTKGDKQHLEFFFEVKNSADYLDIKKLTHSPNEISEVVWVGPTDDIRINPKILEDDLKKGRIVSNEVRFFKD